MPSQGYEDFSQGQYDAKFMGGYGSYPAYPAGYMHAYNSMGMRQPPWTMPGQYSTPTMMHQVRFLS